MYTKFTTHLYFCLSERITRRVLKCCVYVIKYIYREHLWLTFAVLYNCAVTFHIGEKKWIFQMYLWESRIENASCFRHCVIAQWKKAFYNYLNSWTRNKSENIILFWMNTYIIWEDTRFWYFFPLSCDWQWVKTCKLWLLFCQDGMLCMRDQNRRRFLISEISSCSEFIKIILN